MSKELKAHTHIDFSLNDLVNMRFYLAADVDALLAEKDAAIAELKRKLMPCLNGDCILTCEVVEKYGKENAELKAELENVQATAYAEMVDAGMRERKMKRALWLARALRARDKAFEYHFKNNVEMCAKWDNVHLMLMAKAEEYK